MNIRVLLLIPIIFLIIGGCFGGVIIGDDDDFGRSDERIQGNIIDVVPSRPGDVENIAVDVTDDDSGRIFFDITDSSGFFRVEGNFAGVPRVEFFDEDEQGRLLGLVNINVFPNARLDLGNIRLINNTVEFDHEIMVDFPADILENNCDGNTGSITVRAPNDITVDVVVQITNSTDLVVNGDDLTCDDLFIGDEVLIDGILLVGNNVEAMRVEVE